MSRKSLGKQTTCHPHCAELLNEHVAFLRDYRGLAASTLSIRHQYVSAFLFNGLNHRCNAVDLEDLHPSIIHDHVIARGTLLSRAGRKQLVSSLRSVLRFFQVKSYTTHDLSSAVPVIPIAKLDRLPRGISWEDVQKDLAAADRQTLAGRRDYAVLTLTSTYGVRIGQIRSLNLQDIDPGALRQSLALVRARTLCCDQAREIIRSVHVHLTLGER
jgi:site-specific recombinase XerD